MSGLNAAQLEALLAPLSPGRVRSLDGNSHLEAWDVRRWLLRIFGWGGFEIDTLECVVVSERSVWDEQNPLKGRHTVVYRAQVRLTIKDPEGNVLTHFDDGAMGDGINQPSVLRAHDFAMKSALSQALKRCCVNLGEAYGLSLYDGGRAGTTVVGRSLAHTVETTHEVRENVDGGELDEQREQSDASSVVDPLPSEDGAVPPPDQSIEVPSPAPEVDLGVAVGELRNKVIEALALPKREAAQHLTRLNIEASKQRLMEQPTHTPLGEPTTVKLLLDQATKHVARGAA